jgi:hypothetical protein
MSSPCFHVSQRVEVLELPMTYSEKLKDPRWQKKRLEVLSAANFSCSYCGSDEDTLHVHHCYYERGLMPWEYEPDAYKCLCGDCHTQRQAMELQIQKGLSSLCFQELDVFWCYVMSAISAIGVDPVADACNSIMIPEPDMEASK